MRTLLHEGILRRVVLLAASINNQNHFKMADLSNINSDISKYIWYVLTLDPYVPMSWGIEEESIEASEDSVEFKVNGFLHQGTVRITYLEGSDLFQVCLYDGDGAMIEQIDDVYMDSLADTIDQKVEKCENYEEQVMNYLLSA